MEVFETLADFVMNGETPSFILSLGDQSDSSSRSGTYRRFVNTGILKTVPIASIVGNHEKNSDLFSRFFYLPNMDEKSVTDAGDMSGDYWFYYCNTLFLCLDSNNKDMSDHEAFLRAARAECIEKYGEPTFTVASYHHSIFSTGDHADDDTIIERREKYPPLLAAAGVDVVFSGHDHTYTRSYPMDRSTPIKGGTSRDGIVYFTLGSSTGTKFYELSDKDADYAAYTYSEHDPSMTRIDVKGSTMTVTTYVKDKDEYRVLDSYTLSK